MPITDKQLEDAVKTVNQYQAENEEPSDFIGKIVKFGQDMVDGFNKSYKLGDYKEEDDDDRTTSTSRK